MPNQNKRPNSELVAEAIAWLLDNVKEPIFETDTTKDGANIGKIWCSFFTIETPCLRRYVSDPDAHLGDMYTMIFRRIRLFMPDKFKDINCRLYTGCSVATKDMSQATAEMLQILFDWVLDCLHKMHILFIEKYINSPMDRQMAMTLLQKRWRDLWNEKFAKPTVAIGQDENSNAKIAITFTDA